MSPDSASSPSLGPRCGGCQYDLRGSGRSEHCPECGCSLASNTIWPDDPSRLEPEAAFTRSGLKSLAFCAWFSAAPMSGLMLVPACAQVVMLLVAMGTLARVAGWMKFRRSPLRRFDDIGFERSMRLPTIVEPLMAWSTIVILTLVMTGNLSTLALPPALAAWSLAGVAGLLSPTITGIRLARRLDDPLMRFTGVAAISATLLAGVVSFAVLVLMFTSIANPNASTPTIQVTVIVLAVISLIASAIAAHLTRVLITGIQLVFLDDHVEHGRRGPTTTRIGGAWIHFQGGRVVKPTRLRPVNTESIPLEPESPTEPGSTGDA